MLFVFSSMKFPSQFNIYPVMCPISILSISCFIGFCCSIGFLQSEITKFTVLKGYLVGSGERNENRELFPTGKIWEFD